MNEIDWNHNEKKTHVEILLRRKLNSDSYGSLDRLLY